MRRVLIIAALLVVAWAIAEDDSMWTEVHPCPLHQQTAGIPIPDRAQVSHCECEQWWRGQAPARLVFADCSEQECSFERGPIDSTPRIYVDIQLFRCPKCGLLFTEPE